jgi:hypothetical protein
MIMEKFDSIRPYNESEFAAAIERITSHEYLPIVINSVFLNTNAEEYIENMKKYKTVRDFQHGFMRDAVENILKKTSTNFTYDGIDNVKKGSCNMFVSNHRDIALDAAILCYVFAINNLECFEVAIGNNLLQGDFVIDIAGVNKMFKIMRSSNAKDLYRDSVLASEYMRHVIKDKKESVWIAQRNGRTKDGNDKTELGVLKMFSLGNDKPFVENFEEINITPIAISYEYEPCDFLKTMELYISSFQKYVKEPGEDLRSIIAGIMQPKGQINISVTPSITREELEYCDQFEKNAKFTTLAEIMDKRIYKAYKLYKNNYIAHDILNNANTYAEFYSKEEKEFFLNYMRNGLSKLPCAKEENMKELEEIFLKIYANPVENKSH